MTCCVVGSAEAATGHGRANPHGKFLGVVGHHVGGAASPNRASSASNLVYNGGPVMHSDANYAIFWEPPGHSTSAAYKSVIGNYFTSVAADSGKTTNVYSTDTQYYDTIGGSKNFVNYTASYGGALIDNRSYPASGCPSQSSRPCLTDAQIASEVNRVIATNRTPRGLAAVYYVFFPANVNSCFDSTGSTCSFTDFCAYHSSFSSFSGDVLYADMPYAAVPGCDPGQRPNGNPADATLNVLSHENNETITDPLGTAWYDAQGNENGDKCNFVFGASLGGSSGALYNQLINSRSYWLQQEWSNAVGDCLQRSAVTPPPDEAPTASFGYSPSSPTVGASVGFDGSGSIDPDGLISSYSWSFGDGATGTGVTPSHAYSSAGTYTVTLQTTDSAGLSASTSQSITVTPTPPPPPPTDENPIATFTFSNYPNSTHVRFAASGSDPDGSIVGYAWNFGDGRTATRQAGVHTFPGPGTYVVTMTVTDSSGLSGSVTHSVNVP